MNASDEAGFAISSDECAEVVQIPGFHVPVRAQIETGYRLEVITLRKLEFENDPFAFGDKLIEKWYPTVEEGNDKGLLLIVSTAKDGALTGGPKFVKVRFYGCSRHIPAAAFAMSCGSTVPLGIPEGRRASDAVLRHCVYCDDVIAGLS